PGGGLDVGQHVGRPAAGEEARHDLGRHRKTGARQLLRCHGGGYRLAVDQYAVTVENEHGDPRSGRRSGGTPLLCRKRLFRVHAIRLRKVIRVARLWTPPPSFRRVKPATQALCTVSAPAYAALRNVGKRRGYGN